MLIIFLLCAFRSGTDRYYLKKARGQKADGKDILFYLRLKNIPSLLAFYFNYWLRRLLVVLLCFFPFASVMLYLFYYINKGRASLPVSQALFFSALVFAVNGVFYFFRFNSFLFLSRYCFSSGAFSSLKKLFDFSFYRLEGRRGVVLRKKFSFIGWFLSCFFVFPVAFVRSYYMETMAKLANELMQD